MINITCYEIWQMKDDSNGCMFAPLDYWIRQGKHPEVTEYTLVYSGPAAQIHGSNKSETLLNHLYERFNIALPLDYHGRSMSVSDVIVLKDNEGNKESYFVDDIGFTKIRNFASKARVYISGPITGDPDYMKKFSEMEDRLTGLGFQVANPAKTFATLNTAGLNWYEYMEMSFALLNLCTHIYMLPGWENSKGACLERAYAEKRGITIL